MTAVDGSILIVEDSATQAAALAVLLEKVGYRTRVARRAEHALELLREERSDLVLSDVVMPGMDGYELCKRIKLVPEWRDMPVVLLTSLSDPLAIVRGLESGADHYVTKPYEPDALIERVENVLKKEHTPALLSPTTPFTVELLGTPFTIAATKEQILELLVSSYSDLVHTSEIVREAERRARFLGEATEQLSSSLDVDQVLGDLARIVVPRLADSALAVLAGEFTGSDDFSIRVIEQVPASTLRELGFVGTHSGTIDEKLHYALLTIPLAVRKRCFGQLYCVASDAGRLNSPESRSTIQDLVRRASLAVDNALLYSQAQQATRSRDDVLAIVSHDLRNPLNTIQMSTSFLLDELDAAGRQEVLVPQLQLMRRATRRANALIQDLLDVSRIDAGTLAVAFSAVSAATMLEESALELQTLVQAKDISFEHQWDGPDITINADRGRVAQVFSNLVGNAIKFTPRGGLIRISGRRVAAGVEYVVSDKGSGIEEAHIPHLFDRFWMAAQTSRNGAGLGLFIVKGIVEGHGGTVTVESRLGEGTSFRVILPGAPREFLTPSGSVASFR